MINVSAPGSLMLMGEHAVLHSEPALVAAIDKRIHVHATPRNDTTIHAQSNLGHYVASLNNLPADHTWRFVIATLQHYMPDLTHGVDITIHSDIDSTVGFGSSAALVVALTQALAILTTTILSPRRLLQQARRIIHHVQGNGSGSDVAASVYGGVVFYHPATDSIEPITYHPHITAVYCGYKTPTPDVIAHVNARIQTDPAHYARLFADIGMATHRGRQALHNHNLTAFAEALHANQQLMQQLGVCDATLTTIIEHLHHTPGIMAAKISGSGLGDCVIGLCDKPITITPPTGNVIPVTIGSQGVTDAS